MSNYIQIPNSIATKLTKKSKQEEALTYAIIRNEIKDNHFKASIAEKQIAETMKVTERTVNSYVANLKETGLLKVTERKQGELEYPYNVYQFEYLRKDYFVILEPFLFDDNISPKLKGLLLFIKANCWNGTNYLLFNGKTTDLPNKLGVGKNLINTYLSELESKGYIRFIGKSLHITNDCFPLSFKNDSDNTAYKIIYNFCMERNRVPPVKDVDTTGKDEALSWIVGEYLDDTNRLLRTLNKRCKNLPEKLTIRYFCQALRNKLPPKVNEQIPVIIL